MEIYWERYQFPLRRATVEVIREIIVLDEEDAGLEAEEEYTLDYNS